MIILDTNVLSELTKPRRDPNVVRWIANQKASDFFLTCVTVAEVFFGIEGLPAGKRREELLSATQLMLDEQFSGRILPFDEPAARAFPSVVLRRQKAGRPVSTFDAMIAAIAKAHKATVATRDQCGFEDCGISWFNPWDFTD
jgi:predicted nucleic acid-binding protein